MGLGAVTVASGRIVVGLINLTVLLWSSASVEQHLCAGDREVWAELPRGTPVQ